MGARLGRNPGKEEASPSRILPNKKAPQTWKVCSLVLCGLIHRRVRLGSGNCSTLLGCRPEERSPKPQGRREREGSGGGRREQKRETAGDHRWKEAVFVYSLIYGTNIY